jgi:hypothetical protein
MRNGLILLLLLLIVSCGEDSSEAFTEAPDSAFTPSQIPEKNNLQSDTDYIIDITDIDGIDSISEVNLSLLTADGKPDDLHELSYVVKSEQEKIVLHYSIIRKDSILQQDIPLILELKVNSESDAIQYDVYLWDLPRLDELNMPQIVALTSDNTIEKMGAEGTVYFSWINFPAWTPPTQPTWQEDPFVNASWRLYYHSLGWLSSYLELYERTGNQNVLNSINHYLTSYDETFDDPRNTNVIQAYREDSVSLRINNLLYMYFKLYRKLALQDRQVIESLLHKDIQMLQTYLDEEFWDNKNHGMIQAKSALNLVVSFPFHPDINSIESSTHRRITASSMQLFSSEGYVIEQATGYHFVGLSMMLEAKKQIDSFGMTPNLSLIDKIRQALTIAPYLLYHNGTTPAIGDSSYGKNWHGHVKRYYLEFGESINSLDNYLNSRHATLDDLKIIEDEGLAIAKHIPVNEYMSKVFLDAGKSRLIHGHYDHLNIVASLAGEALLVDSGGPYTYSIEGGRDKWRSRISHNTLVLNNEEVGDYSGSTIASFNNSQGISVSAKGLINDNTYHYRSFLLTKENKPLLIVVDEVDESMDKRLVDEYWHFAPKTNVNLIDANHNELTLESGKVFNHYKIAQSANACDILQGEVDANNVPTIGWVTPKYNVLLSSPVEKCSTNTLKYFKVNIFTEQFIEEHSLSQEGDDILIKVDGQIFTYSLNSNQFVP